MAVGALQLCVLLCVNLIPDVRARVTIPNDVDVANVRRSQYQNSKKIKEIVASSDNGAFTCKLDTAQDYFVVKKLTGDTNFWLYFEPLAPTAEPIPTTTTEVTLKGTCDTLVPGSAPFSIRVYVLNNEPPIVTKSSEGLVDISPVPVTTKSGNIVGKVNATDPDRDLLTFTQVSADDGFKIDSGGNIITTKYLALLDSITASINASVDDGNTASVDFTIRVTLDMLNSKPTDNSIITTKVVQENAPEGEEIYTLNVQDTTLYPDIKATLTVSPPSGQNLFKIENNKKISVVGPFDYDVENTYTLGVSVSDGYKSTDYSITINIIDVNDPPSCSKLIYSVQVTEGPQADIEIIPTGFSIIDATDDTHTITLDTYATTFSVVTVSPLKIKPNIDIDCETEIPLPNSLTLTVRVTDQLGAFGTCNILLRCQDINDYTPVFTETTYFLPVSVDLTAGTSIGKVSADDLDITIATNGKVEYSLESSTVANVIQVLTNGDILVNADLNGEYGKVVTGFINATDQGSPRLSSTVQFSFKWNKAPNIDSLPNQDSLSEDTVGEKLIHTIVTSDPEGDLVTCSLVSVTNGGPFIVKRTATPNEYGIYYNGLIDLSTLTDKSIDIVVIAEDGKGGSSSNIFTCTLIPNEAPKANCTSGAITQVSARTTTTRDVVYAIPASDKENDPFVITYTCTPDILDYDSATMALKSTVPLQGVTDPFIDCTITISDGKTRTPSQDKTCDITVTLTEPNKPPKINNNGTLVQWSEHTSVNTELFKFDIKDDEPLTITTTLRPASAASFISVDPTTYAVKLDSTLDYETLAAPHQFVATVVVSDGFLKTTGTVTIEVTDDNDPPVFNQPIYTINIKEGLPLTTNVEFGMNVADTDAGDTHTYRILAPDDTTFAISGKSLINIVELDLDANPSKTLYNLKVEADDGNGGTATADIIVNVEPLNEHTPVFPANAFSNCVVGLLTTTSDNICSDTATDDDKAGTPDSTITYSLGSSTPPYFDIIGNQIRLKQQLQQSNYGQLMYVEVTASDAGNPRLSSSVNVSMKWNKAPVCMAPSDVNIKEDASEKFIPSSLYISADEEGDTVTGTLSCLPDNGAFRVESMKIKYLGTPTLSYTNQPQFSCTLSCKDGNGGVGKQNITIHVTKNQPPDAKCNPAKNKIVDAAAVKEGAEFTVFNPEDPEDDALTYTFIMSPAASVFSINPGTGKLIVSGNPAKQPSETVEITATIKDIYDNTAECKLFITVTNMNEKPVLDVSELDAIAEDSTDIEVAEVPFTDALSCLDEPNSHTATLEVEPVEDKFSVTVDGKKIIINRNPDLTLNHELRDKYTFYITVSDGCLESETLVKDLYVTDINEPPEIRNGDRYAVQFGENDVNVCKPLNCDAYDEDENDLENWDWKITRTDSEKFHISGADCTICLKEEYDLDDEQLDKKNFDLIVEVTDKGDLTTSFKVVTTILEINDNDPLFDEPAYYGTVTNLDTEGKLITTLNVTDEDVLTNGDFTCRAKKCDSAIDGYISINADCKVRLASSMANGFVSSQSYQCDVIVEDNGVPKRSSETKVDIQYLLVTTPAPPPPTEAPDPDADANANIVAGAGAGAGARSGSGSGSGSGSALEEFANGASGFGTGATSLSPGALTGIVVGALAVGGLLCAGAKWGFYRCKSRCASSKGSNSSTRQYNGASRESVTKNNRVSSRSSVKINMMNQPNNTPTKVAYM